MSEATVHHLTAATHERLSAELGHLTTVWRLEIAQKIEAARALGDLSENGDYHAAKDEQGKQEMRIRQLEAILKAAQITDVGTSDVVAPGVTVKVQFVGEDAEELFFVGSIEEHTADEVEIASPTSTLGAAMIGHKVGDVVSYLSPSGKELSLEITEIDHE